MPAGWTRSQNHMYLYTLYSKKQNKTKQKNNKKPLHPRNTKKSQPPYAQQSINTLFESHSFLSDTHINSLSLSLTHTHTHFSILFFLTQQKSKSAHVWVVKKAATAIGGPHSRFDQQVEYFHNAEYIIWNYFWRRLVPSPSSKMCTLNMNNDKLYIYTWKRNQTGLLHRLGGGAEPGRRWRAWGRDYRGEGGERGWEGRWESMVALRFVTI